LTCEIESETTDTNITFRPHAFFNFLLIYGFT
jgi:hypothetical protein